MTASTKYSYKANKELMHQASLDKSVIYWIFLSFIGLFLFGFLFQTALFYGYSVQYEQPLNSAVITAGIMLFLLSIHYFYRWKLENVADLLTLEVWSIPAFYFIASFQAASSHYAMFMVMLNIMYAVFFAIGSVVAKQQRGAQWMQYGIVFAGYTAVFYCFLNMFGNAYYKDAIMLGIEGLRLTSVFQYANAYAAYLLALLLSALWLLMRSRRWYIILLHGSMVVPLLLSFFLTLSRGGLVMLPIILLAILPFYTFIRQISFFSYLAIGSAGALLITEPIRKITTDLFKQVTGGNPMNPNTVSILDSQSLKGWLIMGSVSIITGLIILCSERYVIPRLEQKVLKLNKYRFANLFIPGAMIVFGLLALLLISENNGIVKLLPSDLQKRVLSINFQQHSVLERLTMYKDSLKIVKEYPVTGAGGGGWTTLYQQYQNNPYLVEQVHNFFLQYMVETGLLGFLALIALLISVYGLYARQFFKQGEERGHYQVFYLISVSILLHSILDFEMSYGYLAAVVFLCLGGLSASIKQTLAAGKAGLIQYVNKGVFRYIYPAAIAVLSIVVIIVSVRELQGNRYYNEALVKMDSPSNVSMEEVFESLDAAIRSSPEHPAYLVMKLQLLYQAYGQTKDARYEQEAKRVAALLDRKEPYNKPAMEIEYNQNATAGKLNEALMITERSLMKTVWGLNVNRGGPNWYARAIALNYELGSRALAGNQTEANVKYWNQALDWYRFVLSKQESLKSLPKGQMQGEPFEIKPDISLIIGQLNYSRHNYKEAVEALHMNVNDQRNPDVSKLIVRWYLASLQKLGQADMPVYEAFILKYPEEKAEIAKLAGGAL
ncbi:O-antigen ligase family protein [Paenibacillus radicis (ex Xue et al. 2023)]|uniref:O-antigen ligase family protein n=1 Tax=Paenibacillus radicis (ex Xue et al. 2023) TaxID=2972489 RepID=A0ABT1YCS9_9BACL|nr:O-antigen ligase family protein [Paenibacillus radicis (ex Xue et al. 2023)]MCR8629760.1 O-antigen ligase family protein [Paenibacillus radicis (ex Xue et al. 2023)]